MRNAISLLALTALAALFTSGCATGPEQKLGMSDKLGRGISNTMEITRLGDLRRSIEQKAVFDSPSAGYTAGAVQGLGRTIARTGLGLFEIATFPIPMPGKGYRPICTHYIPPGPVYPDSYKPGLISGSTFDTDTYAGFSGGDVAPFVPGSRFKVFDN
ncbi:MAG TPA: exosortase system-associated protein, TIGR04073 family [Candidatus Acidoferrum sp.]|nr:exosortase system-associated protein, TIGR04073 family [Candidatus Acidoferrum sp.]